MNRRTFFRSLLASALAAAATHYAPSVLAKAAPKTPEPTRSFHGVEVSFIDQMRDAMDLLPPDGREVWYMHPDTYEKLKAIALAKPNRWDRRQRRLAARR